MTDSTPATAAVRALARLVRRIATGKQTGRQLAKQPARQLAKQTASNRWLARVPPASTRAFPTRPDRTIASLGSSRPDPHPTNQATPGLRHNSPKPTREHTPT